MVDQKVQKVRSLAKGKGLDGVLISSQPNFSWLTNGGRGHVALSTVLSEALIFVTQDEIFIITNNIEAQRLKDEEIDVNLKFKLLEYPWFDSKKKENFIADLTAGKNIGADVPMTGMLDLSSEIAELRYILTETEVSRYRELGKDCGEAIGKICKMMRPGISEYQIAGAISSELYNRGIDPIVVLVAVDERVTSYRHPLPTNKSVQNYGMVVICGRRYGLIASVTRLFHFGKLSDELRRKHDAVTYVDTVFISETKLGASIADIFTLAQKAYAEVGFPEEWKLHHQGGPTGYGTRDYVATPGSLGKVLKPQAFAWNPSITGTKSEDTIITTDNKPEIITATPDWPMVTVKYKDSTLERPDILVI